MKRFHVHLHVTDLHQSIAFYSKLFAAEPARIEGDYAKWMLEDPRLNFAISTRGAAPGVDHLGFQVDEAAELADLKHWITDPQGVAWEHFQTLGDVPVFGKPGSAKTAAATCCAPVAAPASASCCGPSKACC